MSNRETVNTNLHCRCLDSTGIEHMSAVSVTEALSTRPQIGYSCDLAYNYMAQKVLLKRQTFSSLLSRTWMMLATKLRQPIPKNSNEYVIICCRCSSVFLGSANTAMISEKTTANMG